MKPFLSLLLAITASAHSIHAQTIETLTLSPSGTPERSVNVPAGQVFELLTWVPSGDAYLYVDGIPAQIALPNSATYQNPPVLSPSFVIAGPHTVRLLPVNGASLVCSYKLKPNGEVATQNVASQVVVIPQTATNPADVILESSTDLITWTAALPGSYSPSASNRFFRVRVVAH